MKEQFNILGRISAYFIKNFRVVYLMLLMICLLGVTAYNTLPREERPEMSSTNVRVTTSYDGVPPEDMESLVTDVIEEALENIEDIESTSSTTSTGNTSISINFIENKDVDEAILEIESELNKISLPEDADDPQIRYFNTVDMPIMDITMSGDYTLVELKTYAESLQGELEQINGVSEITLRGGLDKVLFVKVDRHKLEMYGLSISDLSKAIKNANTDNPIGSTELDTLEYTLRIIGQFSNEEDVEQVVVSEIDGFPVYLKDVASVGLGYADASSVSKRYDSLSQEEQMMVSAVSLRIQRESGADVIQASADVHKVLEESQGPIFPESVIVTISNEDAVVVNEALGDVMSNAFSGLLLVIVVLFIFIGFKESVIVAFVIPLSLLIAFSFMNLFGLTLNTMSMVALILSLGMLVDNAIVIMENIDRVRDEGNEIGLASREATNQVAPAVMAATLTTISAFIPLAFAGGMLGQIMSVIPIVVIFAIGASFFISITVTPTLCARFLGKIKSREMLSRNRRILSILLVCVLSAYAFYGSFIMWFAVISFGGAMYYKLFRSKASGVTGQAGGIIDRYGEQLGFMLKSKRKMLALLITCVVFFMASIGMIYSGNLAMELMPKQNSTNLSISANLPNGYLLEDALIIGEQVEERLFKYPEILNIVSDLSKSKVAYTLEIEEEGDRDISSAELVDQLRNDLSDIVGVSFTVGQKTRGFRGSAYPISVEITGDDSETVAMVASDFVEILKTVEGTTEVGSSLTGGPPEYQIHIDEAKASLYGLTRANVATTIKENIQGTRSGSMVLNGEDIDVEIWYGDQLLNSASDFQSIRFTSKDGTTIYFDQIASVVETKGLQSITHQDMKRIETVNSQLIDGYTSLEVLNRVEEAVANYEMPKNIQIAYAGEKSDIQETFTDLLINMGFAILLVFIILAVQFNSLSQPMVILMAIPLAAIGAIWGLIITGNNFSTYAFFGIVSLVGIAVNDAIVLIDYFNYLRREEGMEIHQAIVEGGKTRFIPVFSTTITTIGGILPLALRDVEYAQLGYALIFGLMVATVLTLVVIPVIYLIVEGAKDRVRSRVPLLVDERC